MLNDAIETRALLIHRNRASRNVDITTHGVIQVESGFTLAAGKLMSLSDQESLLNILLDKPASDDGFIPPNLLVQTSSKLVWYIRASKQTMHFQTDAETVTVTAPMPSLIIEWTPNQIKVAAYKGVARPTLETALFYPPTANVYEDSTICLGNFEMPNTLSIANIEKIEGFIFEGINTHLGSVDAIKGVDDMDKMASFFNSIASKKSFPIRTLLKQPYHKQTVEEWLS